MVPTKNKKEHVDLHFLQNGEDIVDPEDKLLTILRDVPIADIEYSLPFVTTVSQPTLDLWTTHMQTKTKKDESEAQK